MSCPVRVLAASAAMKVEQSARDIGIEDPVRVLVLQLDKAASTTAVAQRFPGCRGQIRQGTVARLLGRHGFRILHGHDNSPSLRSWRLPAIKGGGTQWWMILVNGTGDRFQLIKIILDKSHRFIRLFAIEHRDTIRVDPTSASLGGVKRDDSSIRFLEGRWRRRWPIRRHARAARVDRHGSVRGGRRFVRGVFRAHRASI